MQLVSVSQENYSEHMGGTCWLTRGEARAEGRTEGLTVPGEAQAEGTRACTSVGVRGPILTHAQKEGALGPLRSDSRDQPGRSR